MTLSSNDPEWYHPNGHRCCGPELQRTRVMSTVARCCYQIITVATDENMMSLKTVATEGHSSD
jgi:hypothetical protein